MRSGWRWVLIGLLCPHARSERQRQEHQGYGHRQIPEKLLHDETSKNLLYVLKTRLQQRCQSELASRGLQTVVLSRLTVLGADNFAPTPRIYCPATAKG